MVWLHDFLMCTTRTNNTMIRHPLQLMEGGVSKEGRSRSDSKPKTLNRNLGVEPFNVAGPRRSTAKRRQPQRQTQTMAEATKKQATDPRNKRKNGLSGSSYRSPASTRPGRRDSHKMTLIVSLRPDDSLSSSLLFWFPSALCFSCHFPFAFFHCSIFFFMFFFSFS